MTDDEQQAMERIARSSDGKVLIERLERIRAKHHETDLTVNGDESARVKGRIMEIMDLQREFEEVLQPDTRPKADAQARFR